MSRRRRSGNSPRHPGAGRTGSGRQSGRAREAGGAEAGRADAGRGGKAGSPGQGGKRGDTGRSGPCGRNRSARCRCGSKARRHRGNAGTRRGHPASPAPDILSFEGNAAATRIATLGGPAVIVDEKTAANATEAKTRTPRPDASLTRAPSGSGPCERAPGTAADRGAARASGARGGAGSSSNCRPTRSRNCPVDARDAR